MASPIRFEVIPIDDFQLAAALMAHGYVIQSTSKTKDGNQLWCFPITESMKSLIDLYDKNELMVPISYSYYEDELMTNHTW